MELVFQSKVLLIETDGDDNKISSENAKIEIRWIILFRKIFTTKNRNFGV